MGAQIVEDVFGVFHVEEKAPPDLRHPERQRGDHRDRYATDYAALSTQENDFLRHINMWGSDAYPIGKNGKGHWTWHKFFGVDGSPTVYKTKREATAAIEVYLGLLADRAAGRL